MQVPSRHTPPLIEHPDKPDYPLYSDAPRFFKFLSVVAPQIKFDEWQTWLIFCVLEQFAPDHPRAGQLRFRSVLVSVARQNGKSHIVAALSLYFLFLHVADPQVLGTASNRDQADIIYKRVYSAINRSPYLNKKVAPSMTRGLKFRKGDGIYRTMASSSSALQGHPVTCAILDEAHITSRDVWTALLDSMASQKHSMAIAISTAGDDTSDLLISLYQRADQAIEFPEDDTRFGAFIWEAPRGSSLTDPEAVHAANPAIECGRVDLESRLQDVSDTPEHERRRYLLNQFVTNIEAWADASMYRMNGGKGIEDKTTRQGLFLSIDVGPSLEYGTIAAARKDHSTGFIHTEVIATLANPDIAKVKETISQLPKPEAWVLDPYRQKEVADWLTQNGHKVIYVRKAENFRVASTTYSLFKRSRVRHNRDAIVKAQWEQASAKYVGDSWRLVPVKSGAQIDALMATLYAIWAAEVSEELQEMEILVSKPSAA